MINFLPWRQKKIRRQKRQYLALLALCLMSNITLLLFYYAILQPQQKMLASRLNREKLMRQQQKQNYQHYCHNKKNLTLLPKSVT
ncbi:MAG: hypothetical protein GY821_16685 [Gammaproteobacteria bacterium]|nr:hypothetical protein [Gammaproteobacteria bacterium]